ncbi:MAG: guanosine monophosphate reductase [Melioribacteraceae bacterium]|nr:guanosine monophosphate reductase [Melioribacteraceae bacterium]MCF8264892.1 guanosine monophosphate reductase [Melioribacteraceae bacterium]MCF8432479.1 guanosine monophosphate reductase [Melioribacteraceae bacterium]
MQIYTRKKLNSFELSLTYDDISLVPTEVSEIKSRTQNRTAAEFLGEKINLPVLSSPMDSVTGIEMADKLGKLGCIGIVNRFDSSLKQLTGSEKYENIRAVSIGLNADDELIEKLVEGKYIICIDTANANNKTVLNKCEDIKRKHDVRIILGNVAQGDSLKRLVDAGADAVRIGIGGGSVCSTSIQTGIGLGQVSSLLDCYFSKEKYNLDIELIADGGIKNPGDVSKAIALGADVVMLGRMLAGTKEAPGEVIKYNDQLWKKYRGSASFGVKMKNEFIEGEETMIPYKGTVENVINAISDGLRSAMSYMNCLTLNQLREKDKFVILSYSSFQERLPKK